MSVGHFLWHPLGHIPPNVSPARTIPPPFLEHSPTTITMRQDDVMQLKTGTNPHF